MPSGKPVMVVIAALLNISLRKVFLRENIQVSTGKSLLHDVTDRIYLRCSDSNQNSLPK